MSFGPALFALALVFSECSCLSLVVDAPYQIVPPGKTILRFICQADVPLVGCQVMGLNTKNIFDLSNGNLSSRYWGTGLENGQCGYSEKFTAAKRSYYTYGCRVRAHDSGWVYSTAIKYSHDTITVLPVHTGPRTVIADPGTNVTLAFAAGEPLGFCYFEWNDQSWTSSESSGGFSVDSSKRKQGRCSLTLTNVQPATSDIFGSQFMSKKINGTTRSFIHLTTLIVKMAPGPPSLSLNKGDGIYNKTETLEASCVVGLARPVAQVTWLFNDETIQGQVEDFASLPWEHEAARVTRKLRRRLTMDDDGKELVCRVRHIALPGGVVETRKRIKVLRMAE